VDWANSFRCPGFEDWKDEKEKERKGKENPDPAMRYEYSFHLKTWIRELRKMYHLKLFLG